MTDPRKTSRARSELDVQQILAESYEQNYLALQYVHVQFLTEQLLGPAKLLGGDYGIVIILAVLGQRALEALHSDGDARPADRSMTASRIADITSIPRETVRRKLQKLQGMGLVTQEGDSGWLVSGSAEVSSVRNFFSEEERGHVKRLAKFYVRLNAIIEPF